MTLYGSQEWLDAYKAKINASEEYRKSAAQWEGELALTYEADPDRNWPETRHAVFDLWHGECRDARLVEETEADAAPFAIRGPYGRWKEVTTGQLDPLTGIVQGKLHLRGNMGVIMRYVSASKVLVSLAGEIETEYPDE